MLPAKRQAMILEHIRSEGLASFSDLAALVGASVSTARRDVDCLVEEGHVDRTQGGASLRAHERMAIEPSPALSRELAGQVKAMLGKYAAERISANETVFLDSGTTTLSVAQALARRDLPLTVVTNDVSIASCLGMAPRVEVSVMGGTLRPRSATILGAECLNAIRRLRVDRAIIGAHAVSRDGASETSREHAEIKAAIIEASDVVSLVADSSKFPHRALCRFGELQDFAAVITDSDLPEDIASDLLGAGANLEIAK